MPAAQNHYEKLLEEIQSLIKSDEDEARKKIGNNIQLFNSRFAHGAYTKILKDASKTPVEKLNEIFQVARNLAMREKFSKDTQVHQQIADLTRTAIENVQQLARRNR